MKTYKITSNNTISNANAFTIVMVKKRKFSTIFLNSSGKGKEIRS
jgi:hypothetical protein